MRFLRRFLDRQTQHFEVGGRFESLYALWEAQDTFLYTPDSVTAGPSHVRDGLDLKRLMMTVVLALTGCVFMALYNTGYQANLAISRGALPLVNWQTRFIEFLGIGFVPGDIGACLLHGALYFVPVVLVTFAVGSFWEILFAIIRKHDVSEGFLVTGMLFPLILPPTVPLWQVALGVSFGVVVGKEIFGGTGMNILNPALVARAFVFFAYPAELSGDTVWIAAETSVDGITGATALAQATRGGIVEVVGDITWIEAFIGFIPGSMGETSSLACLFGAVVLIVSGVGSWRIIVSVTIGTVATAWILNIVGSASNAFFDVSPAWHLVVGGWAFGAVYMATDPVSAPSALGGHYIYGFLIGALVVLIRVVNPAYPEGMMLAILFMNLFAPLIDYFAVQNNVRRRKTRYAG